MRAGRADCLEPLKQFFHENAASGVVNLRSDFGKRDEDEFALGESGVGNLEIRIAEN